MSRRIKQIGLFMGDTFLLYFSLWLSLKIRFWQGFGSEVFFKHLLLFTSVYILWLAVFFIVGLYSLTSVWSMEKTLRRFIQAMIINAFVAVFFFYLIPYFQLAPKTILFLDLVIFSLLFAFWRFLYSRILRTVGTTSSLVLIGSQKYSLEFAANILDHPELGYKLVAFFDLNGKPTPSWLKDSGVQIGKNLSQLKKLIKNGKVDLVVVGNDVYSKIFGVLYRLIPTGVSFYNLSSFWEALNRSISISATDELWFLENLRGVRKRLYEVRKRVFDIGFGVLFGFFALLLTPFIVLGVKLSGPGSILYRQKRVGKDGIVFEMIKFRTMVPDAEKRGAQWAKENDPRVTRFGHILRLARLDELPQLINVLRGEMSFIGPRPERPEFVKTLSKKIPHYSLRHLIRPGITGWAQVSYSYGSSEEDARKKLRYDLYYLKHRSLLLDTEIILKTVAVVLSRAGR